MLNRASPTILTAETEVSTATATPITGRDLRRMLRGASPWQRGEIMARFVTGQWRLIWPTPAQAARLGCVHARFVYRTLGHPPKRRRPPSDTDIDDGIACIGLDRLTTAIGRLVEAHPEQLTDTVINRFMAMCDRATAPQRVAAE
jgi:hypothetical protein